MTTTTRKICRERATALGNERTVQCARAVHIELKTNRRKENGIDGTKVHDFLQTNTGVEPCTPALRANEHDHYTMKSEHTQHPGISNLYPLINMWPHIPLRLRFSKIFLDGRPSWERPRHLEEPQGGESPQGVS